MIEPVDAEDLWSAENLEARDFDENDNPYELPDTAPAAALQPTVRDWEDKEEKLVFFNFWPTVAKIVYLISHLSIYYLDPGD